MRADFNFHSPKQYMGMSFRYNWSDPIVAAFNHRLDRSQSLEYQPDMMDSALNSTFMKCHYKDKTTDCFELFRVVMTDAGKCQWLS